MWKQLFNFHPDYTADFVNDILNNNHAVSQQQHLCTFLKKQSSVYFVFCWPFNKF